MAQELSKAIVVRIEVANGRGSEVKQPPIKTSIFLEHFFKITGSKHLSTVSNFNILTGAMNFLKLLYAFLNWFHIIRQSILVEFHSKPEEFF